MILMKHLLLFGLGIFSLSQSATLVRLSGAHPFVVGFWRLLASSLIMAALQWRLSQKQQSTFWEPTSRRHLSATYSSGLFFFLHLWTFFVAAQNTSIANCMVIFATNPIFTAAGAWLGFKEKLQKRHLWAFFFAFTGIGVLFFDRLNFDSLRSGDFAALLSAVFFSGYILTGKKSRSVMSTEQYTWVIYLITAILFLAAGLVQNVEWLNYPLKTWVAIAATVLFPTLLGHVLVSHLLQYFNINFLSCGKLVEPVLSAIVAYYVFGESLSSRTTWAFLLTLLGVGALLSPYLKSRLTFNRH